MLSDRTFSIFSATHNLTVVGTRSPLNTLKFCCTSAFEIEKLGKSLT